MTIDFRVEFDGLMEEYGHAVLLQRTGRKIRCRCWDEKYLEANSKCPICIGTGWVSRMERHTLREKSAVQVIARTSLMQQTELGKMWVDAKTFYMRYDAHPKIGDYIYEVGWTDTQRPSHLIRTYRINDVIPNRGQGGRTEYWTVSLRSESTNTEFQSVLVRSIGPIENYELVTKK